MMDGELVRIDEAIAAASLDLEKQRERARVIESAMAARAAYHALVCDNILTALPEELALYIARDAFCRVWEQSK